MRERTIALVERLSAGRHCVSRNRARLVAADVPDARVPLADRGSPMTRAAILTALIWSLGGCWGWADVVIYGVR